MLRVSNGVSNLGAFLLVCVWRREQCRRINKYTGNVNVMFQL